MATLFEVSRGVQLFTLSLPKEMSKKKTTIKIFDKGKPNILYLPLSIGKKVLKKMAAMQETEKLKEDIPTKVNTEDKNQKSR